MGNAATKTFDGYRTVSELPLIFKEQKLHDMMYMFLQNVFRRVPEDRFHTLLKEASRQFSTDREIYEHAQAHFSEMRSFSSAFKFDLPALAKQKSVLTGQALKLLGNRRTINGYAEIGTTGRYISELRKHMMVSGPIYLIHDKAAGFSMEDIFERGRIWPLGDFISIGETGPISNEIRSESLDLITCYVGLHHIPQEKLHAFVESIWRVLKPGGSFILRDHNADTPEMVMFCSAIHTVFNIGVNVPWRGNEEELRFFNSVDHWSRYLAERGFKDSGERLYQDHDPSANALMRFTKV